MHLTYRNVNEAFKSLVEGIHTGKIQTVRKPSRVGEVLQVPEPVTITYTHPKERVLFNLARDANPFFHLYEALWMLAGRNDVAPLAYYNSNIANYSDDGKIFNGAYGYRWRHWSTPYNREAEKLGLYSSVEEGPTTVGCEMDQLKAIIANLKRDPNSRREVLQMWSVEDLAKETKDKPCNVCAFFSISERMFRAKPRQELDMTVCNRSNDLIWGMLGANVVHFSILQEYVAAHLGVEVGVYNQFTNNLHVYTERWEPEKWLGLERAKDDWYAYSRVKIVNLVKNPEQFDKEVSKFVERHKQDALVTSYNEPFLNEVAQPMCVAFHHYKNHKFDDALRAIMRAKADDWWVAGKNWLGKRKERHDAKTSSK